jgi:glycosyl transferase, family 25
VISLLINLDRSPERLAFFSAQAERCGLVFERLSAVDGRVLSEEQRRAAVAERFEFQPLNAGEIGLFMSHRRAWQRIVDSGQAYGAVFEDDAVLSMALPAVLAGLERVAPAGDVFKLETTGRTVVLDNEVVSLAEGGHGLQRLRTWHGGTAAYAVSQAGAQRLLAGTAPLADPVDQVMFNPMSRLSSSLLIYQHVPALAMQKNILETVDEGSVFNTTLGRQHSGGRLFRHGFWIDTRRAWLKLRERRRRQRLATTPGHHLQRVSLALPHAQG